MQSSITTPTTYQSVPTNWDDQIDQPHFVPQKTTAAERVVGGIQFSRSGKIITNESVLKRTQATICRRKDFLYKLISRAHIFHSKLDRAGFIQDYGHLSPTEMAHHSSDARVRAVLPLIENQSRKSYDHYIRSKIRKETKKTRKSCRNRQLGRDEKLECIPQSGVKEFISELFTKFLSVTKSSAQSILEFFSKGISRFVKTPIKAILDWIAEQLRIPALIETLSSILKTAIPLVCAVIFLWIAVQKNSGKLVSAVFGVAAIFMFTIVGYQIGVQSLRAYLKTQYESDDDIFEMPTFSEVIPDEEAEAIGQANKESFFDKIVDHLRNITVLERAVESLTKLATKIYSKIYEMKYGHPYEEAAFFDVYVRMRAWVSRVEEALSVPKNEIKYESARAGLALHHQAQEINNVIITRKLQGSYVAPFTNAFTRLEAMMSTFHGIIRGSEEQPVPVGIILMGPSRTSKDDTFIQISGHLAQDPDIRKDPAWRVAPQDLTFRSRGALDKYPGDGVRDQPIKLKQDAWTSLDAETLSLEVDSDRAAIESLPPPLVCSDFKDKDSTYARFRLVLCSTNRMTPVDTTVNLTNVDAFYARYHLFRVITPQFDVRIAAGQAEPLFYLYEYDQGVFHCAMAEPLAINEDADQRHYDAAFTVSDLTQYIKRALLQARVVAAPRNYAFDQPMNVALDPPRGYNGRRAARIVAEPAAIPQSAWWPTDTSKIQWCEFTKSERPFPVPLADVQANYRRWHIDRVTTGIIDCGIGWNLSHREYTPILLPNWSVMNFPARPGMVLQYDVRFHKTVATILWLYDLQEPIPQGTMHSTPRVEDFVLFAHLHTWDRMVKNSILYRFDTFAARSGFAQHLRSRGNNIMYCEFYDGRWEFKTNANVDLIWAPSYHHGITLDCNATTCISGDTTYSVFERSHARRCEGVLESTIPYSSILDAEEDPNDLEEEAHAQSFYSWVKSIVTRKDWEFAFQYSKPDREVYISEFYENAKMAPEEFTRIPTEDHHYFRVDYSNRLVVVDEGFSWDYVTPSRDNFALGTILLTGAVVISLGVVIYKLCVPTTPQSDTGVRKQQPHKTNIVDAVVIPQGSVQRTNALIEANRCKLDMHRENDSMTLGGLFLDDKTIITCRHSLLVKAWDVNMGEEPTYAVTVHRKGESKQFFKGEYSLAYSARSDLAMVRLHKPPFQGVPSVWKYLSNGEVPTSSKMAFVLDTRTHTGKDVSSPMLFPLSDIKIVTRKEIIEYTAIIPYKPVYGDCGNFAIYNYDDNKEGGLVFAMHSGIQGSRIILTPVTFLLCRALAMSFVDDGPLAQALMQSKAFDIVGMESTRRQSHVPTVHNIIETPFYGMFGPPKTAPCMLKPVDGKSPLIKSLETYEVRPYRAYTKLEERVCDIYRERQYPQPAECEPTDEFLISRHRPSMNASMGWPFGTSEFNLHTKKMGILIKENDHTGLYESHTYEPRVAKALHLTCQSLVDKTYDQRDHKVIYTLKIDTLPLEKVEEGATRSFNVVGLLTYLITMIIAGPLLHGKHSYDPWTNSTFGLNVHGPEWEQTMFPFLARNLAMDMDYRKMDRHHHPDGKKNHLRSNIAYLQRYWKTNSLPITVDKQVYVIDIDYALTVLCQNATRPIMILNRYEIQPTRDILVSGSAWTGELNAQENDDMIATTYVGARIRSGLDPEFSEEKARMLAEDLESDVYARTHGDDLIATLLNDDLAKEFNCITFAATAAELGHEVTPATKGAALQPFIPTSTATFLKRRIVITPDEATGLCYLNGPRPVDDILESLNWRDGRSSNDVHAWMSSSVNSVMDEMSHHPRSVYNHYRQVFIDLAVQLNFTVDIDSYSKKMKSRGVIHHPLPPSWKKYLLPDGTLDHEVFRA
jgi:hypothetical protein